MSKLLRTFLLAALPFFSAALPVQADDLFAPTEAKAAQEGSLLNRYTNRAQDVILQGLKFIGIHYRRGGESESGGMDCSGYVRLVFKESIGTALPRTAKEMSKVGEHVAPSALKPGDLVFFNTMRRAFSHVGIYLGDNHFLHAPRPGAEIRVENMSNSYWLPRFNGARRVIDE